MQNSWPPNRLYADNFVGCGYQSTWKKFGPSAEMSQAIRFSTLQTDFVSGAKGRSWDKVVFQVQEFAHWSSMLQERWDNHVILRSSIIYGPQAPYPVSRTLFLQFIERTLKAGRPTKFFSDEFRSPVFVQDIISVIRRFIEYPSEPLDKRWEGLCFLPSSELSIFWQ